MHFSKTSEENLEYFKLNGLVSLVTGATSGLGRHFARTLANAGCLVGISGRRENLLIELVAEIEETGGSAIALPMDVTNEHSILEQFHRLEKRFGLPKILVNNAGIASFHGILDAPKDETSEVFAVNQTAVWNLAQVFAKKLVESNSGGSIINISSIAGLGTIKGAASYAVSKAAVAHLTKILALELAPYGIRANSIAPGYFKTELNKNFLESSSGKKITNRIPLGRTGEFEDLDGLLLLLSSERGSFISGAVIPIDGGHLISNL